MGHFCTCSHADSVRKIGQCSNGEDSLRSLSTRFACWDNLEHEQTSCSHSQLFNTIITNYVILYIKHDNICALCRCHCSAPNNRIVSHKKRGGSRVRKRPAHICLRTTDEIRDLLLNMATEQHTTQTAILEQGILLAHKCKGVAERVRKTENLL